MLACSESTQIMRRAGYFSFSSSTARRLDWNVPESPLENAR